MQEAESSNLSRCTTQKKGIDMVWVVVEYMIWEHCDIVGIFETEQEAIDMQADYLKERKEALGDPPEDYYVGR